MTSTLRRMYDSTRRIVSACMDLPLYFDKAWYLVINPFILASIMSDTLNNAIVPIALSPLNCMPSYHSPYHLGKVSSAITAPLYLDKVCYLIIHLIILTRSNLLLFSSLPRQSLPSNDSPHHVDKVSSLSFSPLPRRSSMLSFTSHLDKVSPAIISRLPDKIYHLIIHPSPWQCLTCCHFPFIIHLTTLTMSHLL